MKQCGRSKPMSLTPASSFDETLAMARHHDLRLIFWEQVSGPPPLRMGDYQKPASLFVMIGPEGWFEPEEIEKAKAEGFRAISMGPRILRAETAALAASTLVQFQFGDMGYKLLDKPGAV